MTQFDQLTQLLVQFRDQRDWNQFHNPKDLALATEIRIKWWEDPSSLTYRSISIEPLDVLPDVQVDLSKVPTTTYYPRDEKPVFFGHYWLKGEPFLQRANVCCLDYSVANDGKLAAYRLDDAPSLSEHNIVFV